MPVIPGTPGDDLLYGTEVPDTITGDAGNDRLWGFGGDDTLEGGADSDILDGGLGADTMRGGTGNDYYIVDNIGDLVIENSGEGSDFVYSYIDYTLTADVERLAVYDRSTTYAINLTGNALDNELIGNNGNNILDGGTGADIMQGGLGDDTFIVDNAGDKVVEQINGGTDTVLVNFSTGSGFHAAFDYSLREGQRFTGNDDPHIERLGVYDWTTTNSINFHGSSKDNELLGNNGINVLEGWYGNDIMRGYGGDDIYYVESSGDQVIEQSGDGTDTVYIGYALFYQANTTSLNFTLADEVERMFVNYQPGTQAYQLTGNGLDNELVGNAGANVLDGGAGADLMQGLGGDDVYIIDNLLDRAYESSNAGTDTVRTSVDYSLVGQYVEKLEALDAAGTAALHLIGNGLSNTVTGNAGANVLDGQGGGDTLIGLGGDDTYIIYAGDTVTEAGGGGFDTVYTNSMDYALSANVERAGVNGNYTTYAANFAGNDLDNEIWGNEGANVLDGGAGRDVLYGYGGADTFTFSSTLVTYYNVDVLADFQAGSDRIALEDTIFQGLPAGALSADAFRLGTDALDADDRILYDSATGSIYYDGDGNGTGLGAMLFAQVHAGTSLTSSDFIVV